MILYHYVPLKNTVLQEGLLSVSRLPNELKKYAKRAKSDQIDQIKMWLDKTFPGRDQSVSVLTEPIRWKGCDPMLKEWLATRQLIAIDFDKLNQDCLIETVWCKEQSDKNGVREVFRQINADQIDISPLAWEKCSSEKGLFFGAIRHYFLVMKNGVIPPKYLIKTKET